MQRDDRHSRLILVRWQPRMLLPGDRMWRIVAVTLCLLHAVGNAQTPVATAAPHSFEVASIKPSNAGPNSTSGIHTGHGRLDAENVTLLRCILGAYGVGPQQIIGGPDWLNTDHFEISAKADRPVESDAELMVLLQGLLAERFKLVVHREKKIARVFVLEVAKNGPKLEKAEPGEAGTNTSNTNTAVTIAAHNTDMDALARVLGRQTDLPVVNQTGLQGIFNFKLTWTPERARQANSGGADAPSLFTAIQEQLGLRLRQQNAPLEMLVIEHAEKPTAN